MSEMLGNQYFLSRNYSKAAEILEVALKKDQSNKRIRSKLIVCYIQILKPFAAWNLFIPMIEEDISFIIDMDPVLDDCPCSEIVEELEVNIFKIPESFEYFLSLGMLWLYCEIDKSKYYFEKVLAIEPKNHSITQVLTLLNNTKNHE